MPSSHSPTTLTVAFDDTHAVANAGLILTATLAERLVIEALVDQPVDLGERPGAHRPGRKLLTLPGRLTRSARRHTLHLPAGWPWPQAFTRALARLRTVPGAAPVPG